MAEILAFLNAYQGAANFVVVVALVFVYQEVRGIKGWLRGVERRLESLDGKGRS